MVLVKGVYSVADKKRHDMTLTEVRKYVRGTGDKKRTTYMLVGKAKGKKDLTLYKIVSEADAKALAKKATLKIKLTAAKVKAKKARKDRKSCRQVGRDTTRTCLDARGKGKASAAYKLKEMDVAALRRKAKRDGKMPAKGSGKGGRVLKADLVKALLK